MSYFSTRAKSLSKIVASCALMLFLAACQTTGLKPGNLQSNFAPAGWVSKKSGKTITYLCLPYVCKTYQAVSVQPMKVKGNAEEAIRNDVLSKELVDSLLRTLKIASKGKISASPVRKISTKAYSGFEAVAKVKTASGYIYFAERQIIQGNRGTKVISVSHNRSTALRNLRRYMARTKISR